MPSLGRRRGTSQATGPAGRQARADRQGRAAEQSWDASEVGTLAKVQSTPPGSDSRRSHPLPGAVRRRVSSGDVELAVAELGEPHRPTVVLVHGYPDSKEVWSRVAARLAERFHVVLYDVRGCGESSAPKPLRGGFTLEKLTDDFVSVLDAVSPNRPVHVVGHDWGSVQSWEFVTVSRTEGRIASFTSISGPSLDHFGHWINKRLARPSPRRIAQLLGQGAKSWYVYLLHTPALPELAWRGPLGSQWPRLLRRGEKLPADGYPMPSLPRDAAHGAWLYRDNVRARLSRPRTDCSAHAPVQLVTPTGDLFLSPHLYDELEAWTPSLRRRTLPTGHWAPRSRPDQLARQIAEFAELHEGGTSADAVDVPRGAHAERFAGQLVLVTGAASGIGHASLLAFAEAGARVIAVDRDGAGAVRAAEAARFVGAPQAWAQTVDVAVPEEMERLAAKVAAEYGTLDVLVNNAGIGVAGSFWQTDVAEWRRALDVNLWGVLHGCRLFGRQMVARGQGGHIENIASAAAFQPSRMLPAYATSKAAVLMLSECLRAELAGEGIGVSAICPGIVDTPITRTARFVEADGAQQQKHRARTARLYRLRGYPPQRVARAVVRAVVRNQAVVPVTPEAHAARALSRMVPKARRALARVRPPV